LTCLDLQSTANIATAIGVVVLAWYTLETYKLRKEAESQTAMTVIPVLYLSTRRRTENSLILAVENIGRGPAFHVHFEPLAGDGLVLRFKPISLVLQAEQYKEVEFATEDSLTEPYESVSQAIASRMSQQKLPEVLALKASFQDLGGKGYESEFQVKLEESYAPELLGELSITFCGQTELPRMPQPKQH
jgi:hypothetical protein